MAEAYFFAHHEHQVIGEASMAWRRLIDRRSTSFIA
jgi:hypothetical protein